MARGIQEIRVSKEGLLDIISKGVNRTISINMSEPEHVEIHKDEGEIVGATIKFKTLSDKGPKRAKPWECEEDEE